MVFVNKNVFHPKNPTAFSRSPTPHPPPGATPTQQQKPSTSVKRCSSVFRPGQAEKRANPSVTSTRERKSAQNDPLHPWSKEGATAWSLAKALQAAAGLSAGSARVHQAAQRQDGPEVLPPTRKASGPGSSLAKAFDWSGACQPGPSSHGASAVRRPTVCQLPSVWGPRLLVQPAWASAVILPYPTPVVRAPYRGFEPASCVPWP